MSEDGRELHVAFYTWWINKQSDTKSLDRQHLNYLDINITVSRLLINVLHQLCIPVIDASK
jgi:BarA-like signal transduction histidine kinase